MSIELIVNRVLLQNQMKDLVELFSFMENDGTYSINDSEITLYYEKQDKSKSIEYLDLDAVNAKYSDVDFETLTVVTKQYQSNNINDLLYVNGECTKN